MGDSIAQDFLAPEASQSFANRLAVFLNARYLNQAVGGGYYWPDMPDEIDQAPDVALISYGTNDWTRG